MAVLLMVPASAYTIRDGVKSRYRQNTMMQYINSIRDQTNLATVLMSPSQNGQFALKISDALIIGAESQPASTPHEYSPEHAPQDS
ncbi:hypothetical protein ACEQ8H_008164 [Pleosporales sp. CAS-2024a]